MELFKTVPGYSWLFIYYSIKLIEKLSRRHLINSSDVFVIKGFTVCYRTYLSFSYLFVKSKLEEIRGHKFVPVMSHKFYLLLILSSLQCLQPNPMWQCIQENVLGNITPSPKHSKNKPIFTWHIFVTRIL